MPGAQKWLVRGLKYLVPILIIHMEYPPCRHKRQCVAIKT